MIKQWGCLFLWMMLVIFPNGDLFAKHNQSYKNKSSHYSSSYSKGSKVSKKPSAPYVSQKNYQQFWHKSTFPSNQSSIDYHTKKHGKGRTSLKYTRDAVNFYEKNKHLRQPFTLRDGSPGYKIKKGSDGGTWTKNGKIVTFWG